MRLCRGIARPDLAPRSPAGPWRTGNACQAARSRRAGAGRLPLAQSNTSEREGRRKARRLSTDELLSKKVLAQVLQSCTMNRRFCYRKQIMLSRLRQGIAGGCRDACITKLQIGSLSETLPLGLPYLKGSLEYVRKFNQFAAQHRKAEPYPHGLHLCAGPDARPKIHRRVLENDCEAIQAVPWLRTPWAGIAQASPLRPAGRSKVRFLPLAQTYAPTAEWRGELLQLVGLAQPGSLEGVGRGLPPGALCAARLQPGRFYPPCACSSPIS